MLALFPDNADFSKDWKNNSTGVCCNPGTPSSNCLVSASCDGRPDDLIACDSNSGVGGSSLINNVHLSPGRYFVVVRARQGAPDNKLPFNISVRDQGALGSSYCDATDAVDGQARIRQVLQPGTYWVALTGSGSSSPTSGAYSLRFRDYAPVANAAPELACNTTSDTINYDVPASHVGQPYYVVVKGDTSADKGPYKLTVENLQAAAGMGCNADPQSPDAFYRFSLNADTNVSIDTSGSTLDTVIAVYPVGVTYFGTNYAEDVNGAVVGCDDNGAGGTASQITAQLPAGDYYLAVKGRLGAGASWGSTSQPYAVSIRDVDANSSIACAPAANPTLTQALPAGDYKLVVSDDGSGGSYDVRFKDLSAVANSATQVACNDVNDTIDYTVQPNTPYYVIVKGDGTDPSTQKGAYSLVVESVDTGATSMGCGADPHSADAFFKFTVTHQTDVTIDTAGSQLDTVIALYPGSATVFGTNYAQDAFGNVISCNNDAAGLGTASKISATLATGDYYVVVKGHSATWGQSALPFNLSIRDDGVTRAITCANSGTGAKITQTLDPGDYAVVLSDTDARGAANSGGAYSITFKDLSAASGANGVQIGCALGTLDGGDGDGDGKPDGVHVDAGQDYYVVVKGNAATDSGPYSLTVDDIVSSQAASGSTPIACAAAGSSIDATYPAGDYYAVVSGPTVAALGTNGAYELKLTDVDPFLDYNRIACDADSGPNSTSVIEADLQPGPHYVVLKGDGPGQTGSYQLNVRDMSARPDHRLACGGVDESHQLTYDVKADKDYTVLLKGDAKFQQGNFNIKLYDELGLQQSSGSRLQCQTVCPEMPPYTTSGSPDYCCKASGSSCSAATDCCSGTCTSGKCATGLPSFTTTLAPDTYYLTVKGRRAQEKGFYELQIGDPSKGSSATKYTAPTWPEVNDALVQSGVKVLPVLSCPPGGNSNNGLCDEAESQVRAIAALTGAKDKSTGQGLVEKIKDDGTGIGSGLALAIRDLAQYLAMDITLSVVDNPGFTIEIQKCTNAADATQAAVCKSYSQGCTDSSTSPKNTIAACQPGATPKFFVQFTNPLDPNAVPPNPNDPNGGYHFKLQIVGNKQYVLDEIPVYIIPTDEMGPPPPSPGGAGTYTASGSYEQEVFGAGCNYYQVEGEEPGNIKSCGDGIDNNGDGTRDRGVDMNMDGDFLDPGDIPPDPGCMPGSCLDGIDNDGDGLLDLQDPDCATNTSQDWTDLFFKADVPPGTSIDFDVCTGETEADLTGCTFSRVATVTSASGSCATNTDCKNLNDNGTLRDGFCGTGGQCQFITPPKESGFCTADNQCPNGLLEGETVASYCNGGTNQCKFTTPPADIGSNLMDGQNGKPFVKMRITMNSDSNQSKTPTLYDWYMEYVCATSN